MVINEKGQILIIFVGIMALSLGVGLAMSRRGILSLEEGNRSITASKAYYAAEGGAEKGLADPDILTNCPDEAHPCSLALGDCAVSYYGEDLSNYAITLGKDRLIVLNTEGATGNINISWNEGVAPNALELTEIYDSVGGLTSRKWAFNCNGANFDGFENSAGGSGSYNCSTGTINFSGDSKRLVIKILLAGGVPSGHISFTATGLLPSQAVAIYSTATCGNTKKTVKVTKPFFSSGQDFSFGLFAPNSDLSL